MSTTTGPMARTLTLEQANFHFRRWRDLLVLELYGVDAPIEWDEPIAPELLQAIDAGVIRTTAGRSGERVDIGSFRAWLLRQGVAPPCHPIPANRLDATSRDIHPGTAVAWRAFGDAWTPARVAAFVNRMHRVQLMLCDHDAGAVVLDPATLALANEILSAEIAFNAARDELEIKIRSLDAEAYSADSGRILHAGDFANSIWLDVVEGRYVVAPTAPMLSDEWFRGTAAAERIGAVRLSARFLTKNFGCRRDNARRRTRAAADLRGMFEAWLVDDAPMPKRVEWEQGRGLELAGTANAAGVVWEKVTKDPRYAAVRRPGRRPGTKNTSK